jgi:hypothetical protein
MVGRAWACVLLIATLTGCASRSRPKPFLPSMSIPPECTTSIHLVGCDSFSPPHYIVVGIEVHLRIHDGRWVPDAWRAGHRAYYEP